MIGVAVFSVSVAAGQECVNNVDCDDGDACTFDRCVNTACSNTPAAYGDVVGVGLSCGPDEDVQLGDFLAVLEGFAGIIESVAPGCSEHSVDLSGPGGCEADGLVDLYDILAVRDALLGIDYCCRSCAAAGECDDGLFCNGVEVCDGTCQPGWADVPCKEIRRCDEGSDACVNSSTRMFCEISPQRVQPGGTVTVDLFLQHVSNLGGYQAAIDVTRLSGSGEVTCAGQCASVDLFRPDNVFLINHVGAADSDGLRVASTGLSDPVGVDVGSTPAYMGSFEFTISEDAAVGSVFGASVRTGQPLLSPSRNPIPYSIGSTCNVTVAPTDCNDNGVEDACDIACGADGGECDVPGCGMSADCNENGSPDECDLAQGISKDCGRDPDCGPCTPNGVPDECDGDFRMFFVPAGDDPAKFTESSTVVNAVGRQGETITIDVFLQNSPIPVRGVGCALPCVAPGGTGGTGGSIEYAEGSGFVERFREDYIYFGGFTDNAFDDSCDSNDFPHIKTVSALTNGQDVVPLCDTKYFFTFELAISPDAAGVFTLDFVDFEHGFTVVADVDSRRIPGLALGSLVIDMGPGDCDRNGVPDQCEFDCGPAGGECDIDGCGSGIDCNANDSTDACDLVLGTSLDINHNDIPDECDSPDAEPRLFFVPQGAAPEDYAFRDATFVGLQPGKSRTLEVWVQNTGRPLDGYLVLLDNAVGGEIGEVSYVDPAIDQLRPDWVFAGLPDVNAGAEVGPPALMFTFAPSAAATIVIEPRYCGEITYAASLNACGTFSVDFVNPGSGLLKDVSHTLLLDNEFGFDFNVAGAVIVVSEERYGDVNSDGTADLLDILCMLDGFMGDFSRCSLSQLDITPCGGDGVITLRDIMHVQNGFSGQPSPCPVVCP